ncbi:MAG: DNA/RNA non-specific endonuclease [Spirochaetes bacterium]|nr:MAG: DNA/RNA non-specific endonuclease [Spirochaetota bacterium]
MRKFLITLGITLLSFTLVAQTIKTDNKLIIPHGDITLYLTKDTCSMVSKHVISYSEFLKLDKERDNKWFQDTYKGKYTKDSYLRTGYDIGHLTPSHITSYDNVLNHSSFSLFNAAPQLAAFNRGKWAQLEGSVEDSIAKYKKDAVIITGVIYDNNKKKFMGDSRIPIPVSFYKILFIDRRVYCWIGSNINGEIIPTTLKELNELFKLNKMSLNIK